MAAIPMGIIPTAVGGGDAESSDHPLATVGVVAAATVATVVAPLTPVRVTTTADSASRRTTD